MCTAIFKLNKGKMMKKEIPNNSNNIMNALEETFNQRNKLLTKKKLIGYIGGDGDFIQISYIPEWKLIFSMKRSCIKEFNKKIS